ncbi:hypothetical protein ACJJTC_012235 [Scirpophaga incertulas]
MPYEPSPITGPGAFFSRSGGRAPMKPSVTFHSDIKIFYCGRTPNHWPAEITISRIKVVGGKNKISTGYISVLGFGPRLESEDCVEAAGRAGGAALRSPLPPCRADRQIAISTCSKTITAT